MAKANNQGKGAHKEELSGKQKAAIFLVTLGAEISSEVFKHLREDEIEILTFEIARLENIAPESRDVVLQEFQELMMAQDFISSGGIDYARELLEKSLGSQKAVDIINRLTSSLKTRPFDFVRRTDPSHLLNFIQQEHPQTIALILAYLEPLKASQILGQLPQEKQSDVAKRIATMDRTSPEILREVERVLEKKLSSLSSEDYTSAGGVPSIVDILNLVDRTTEKTIIESLEEDDPELAEEIKKRMFVFEDIIMLDDRAVQRVMREVDTAELAKALKAVDPEVQDKIYRNMSKRAASLLKEDMDFMGPTRRKDVEEAQQKIVSVIRKLEEQGEVVIARSGEEDVLV
ncbi:MAG: flagellar motor switch protein FliG [Spirochaetaceae bacterium 4572_59]|nr:MAG: flagellar motor switch protein FliG [Spirochaetaceae bacterium 4572_59]